MGVHEIRARYDERVIRVYQAYSPEIGLAAVRAQKFVPPFKMGRMTWIKPSFNWMMYRCGFGRKEGQHVVLGVDISREGFEWALRHAALSRYLPGVHSSEGEWRRSVDASPVRAQWDPERDWRLGQIDGVRSLQMGLSAEAVERYVSEWIVGIEDVTAAAHQMGRCVAAGVRPEVLPSDAEQVYPVDAELRQRVCVE
ncbi:MAG TPA: DUF4291 domain-containing protein [Gemmatimonadales bacterium]|nr:DUF4291 domain-containing protein [Gemmatimonadales bacterium]